MACTEILLEILNETLENVYDIIVSGFGKVYVKEKAVRKESNLATGRVLSRCPEKLCRFCVLKH